jgi:uncharacterized protein YbaR (Trm112 family)
MPYPETTIVVCPKCQHEFLVLTEEIENMECPQCNRVIVFIVDDPNKPDPRHIC